MKKNIFLALGIMIVAGVSYGFYLFNKPRQSVAKVEPDFQLQSTAIIGEYEKDENCYDHPAQWFRLQREKWQNRF